MGQTQQRQEPDEELELNSIQDLYKSFIMECPSGSLYLHEFKRMFGVQSGTPESQYMDNIFRAFDMNHDNTMDFIEYVAALHLVLRGKLEDKLRWSFKVFDSDDNGRLDRKELRKIVRIIYKIKDGSICDETGKESLTSEQVCDRIFQQVDINSDGQITLDEFLNGAQKSQWLQSFLTLDINPSGWVQRYLCDRKITAAKDS
ncbi:guanylyl cyclase-activating protein 2-like [Dunckerocampus dactyliophorus]|uniref:guanylyl cyclase-activating protein 2-like n=1 Tax=Dunckerocampus dactyliophorus TaxID=161453 RepID=UPI002405F87E|nr:guanylyl cyclase-activating protein 2-like [Dunckerocampus dactyliophorus]